MASEKGKPRATQNFREEKPAAGTLALMEGQDLSSLNAMLLKIEKQKEPKKDKETHGRERKTSK
jgi:hypothetical protein